MAQASIDDARRLCVRWLPSYHPFGSRVEDLHITSSQAVALIKQLIEDEDCLSSMLNLKRIQVEALIRSDAQRELVLAQLQKKYEESQAALATANLLVTELNELVAAALPDADAGTQDPINAEMDVSSGPEEGEIVEDPSSFGPNGPNVQASANDSVTWSEAFAPFKSAVFPWYRTMVKANFEPKHWYQNTNEAAHRAMWHGSRLAIRDGAGVDHGC